MIAAFRILDCSASDVGKVRSQNEDSAASLPPGRLFTVASRVSKARFSMAW